MDKIRKIYIRSPCLSFCNNALDHRTTNTLDGIQAITDGSTGHGKCTFTLIYIRCKNTDVHLPTGQNILGHLRGVIDDRCHQRCHKFHRIIIFQPRSLIGNYRISRCMGFIKCIFCKVDHIIIDLICHIFLDTSGNTPRYAFRFISIYKVLAFLLHDSCLLL